MRMSNFTMISMFISSSVFFILLTYTVLNDKNYERLVWAILLDVILNFINIYLHWKPSDSKVQKLHNFVPEIIRAVTCGLFILNSSEPSALLVHAHLIYIIPIVYRLFSCTRYGKTRFLGELSEALLFLSAYLFMLKFYVKTDISMATCIAPLFYFVLCLAILRLCLVLKVLSFIFTNLFSCYNEVTKRGRLGFKYQNSKFSWLTSSLQLMNLSSS